MARTQAVARHANGAVKRWPDGRPVKRHPAPLTICPGEGCEDGVITVDYCPGPRAVAPAQRYEDCPVCQGTGEVEPERIACCVHGESRLELRVMGEWRDDPHAVCVCAGQRLCGCGAHSYGCDELDEFVGDATCPDCGQAYRDADHEGGE